MIQTMVTQDTPQPCVVGCVAVQLVEHQHVRDLMAVDHVVRWL
jgi:hypothetical protein